MGKRPWLQAPSASPPVRCPCHMYTPLMLGQAALGDVSVHWLFPSRKLHFQALGTTPTIFCWFLAKDIVF